MMAARQQDRHVERHAFDGTIAVAQRIWPHGMALRTCDYDTRKNYDLFICRLFRRHARGRVVNDLLFVRGMRDGANGGSGRTGAREERKGLVHLEWRARRVGELLGWPSASADWKGEG